MQCAVISPRSNFFPFSFNALISKISSKRMHWFIVDTWTIPWNRDKEQEAKRTVKLWTAGFGGKTGEQYFPERVECQCAK
jgi:hypothetical protein